jgi:hypothetical protein
VAFSEKTSSRQFVNRRASAVLWQKIAFDVLFDVIPDRPKHPETLSFAANGCGRVLKGPVQTPLRPRKDRAGFVCGIANGDDVVERLPEVLV